MNNYPIYILDLDKTTIVFPADKEDLDHCEFWEKVVYKQVADHYHVDPSKRLKNLPYCQRRARIVGSRIYYGEKDCNNELLQLIRQTLGDDTLVFYFDQPHKRLREDVRRFQGIIRKV
jgi:hypothetical protein